MDDLVRTAELMRERASAATQGPWHWVDPGGPCRSALVSGDWSAAQGWRIVVPAMGAEPDISDAAYIASMDPHVGHAVADLLDVISEILSGRAMPDAALEVAARDVASAYLGDVPAAGSRA